jgi:hypothetical protein
VCHEDHPGNHPNHAKRNLSLPRRSESLKHCFTFLNSCSNNKCYNI